MASHNPSRIIRTQFWIREVMRAFGFDSYMDIAKLFAIPLRSDIEVHEEFWELARRVTDNQELALEAHKIFIEDGISDRNWGKYYNGKQARSKKKKKLNDAFDKLVPQAGRVFEHGKYNILSIIESNFVEDAMILFVKGLKELHLNLDLKKQFRLRESSRYKNTIKQLSLSGYSPEDFHLTEDPVYREACRRMLRGDFEVAFNLFTLFIPIISKFPLDEEKECLDFLLIDLASKIIRANYFSGGFIELANEQNLTLRDLFESCNKGESPTLRYFYAAQGHSFCLDYIRDFYGINKSLWTNSYRIFESSNKYWVKPEPLLGNFQYSKDDALVKNIERKQLKGVAISEDTIKNICDFDERESEAV